MIQPPPKDHLRLVSWNVNGIRSILQKGLLEFIEASHVDVLCLQEIKARPEQVTVDWPAGYEAIWNPAEKAGYSGTAILTRRPPLSVSFGIGDESHDREGRVLTAEFPGYYLVNVYVPNSKRELTRLGYRVNDWSPAFLGYLKALEQKKPVLFCGDLNVAHQEIDLARPKQNTGTAGFTPEERRCFGDLVQSGFVDTFRHFESGGGHYSWWSYQSQARARNIGWRIDYFCASPALVPALQNAFIWPHVMGSDHCPVGVDLKSD